MLIIGTVCDRISLRAARIAIPAVAPLTLYLSTRVLFGMCAVRLAGMLTHESLTHAIGTHPAEAG